MVSVTLKTEQKSFVFDNQVAKAIAELLTAKE